ncbi:MAG: LacI family transcriptional regulator [Ruminococcaceae bacterium]|nr:LacI family transcriptional regulator [Oscillospiraceae bacterium]
MIKRVTIKDVAQDAGVSISVVSYVLNGAEKPVISEATRSRVLESVKRLGYVPNRTAAALRRGKSNTIGVISYWTHSYVYGSFIDGITSAAKELGYNTLIYQAPLGNTEPDFIRYYADRMFDGVLLILPYEREKYNFPRHLAELERLNVPYAAIGDPVEGFKPHSIHIDYANTVYTACQYFIKKGYSRVTYVTPHSETYGALDRFRGYTEVMRDYGLVPDVCWVEDIERRLPDFDAVVTFKSEEAQMVLRAATAQGKKVPQDFEMIAANTESFAEYMIPPLSTVRLPDVDMGAAAAKLLIDLIDGEPPYYAPDIPSCTLALRGTTHERNVPDVAYDPH